MTKDTEALREALKDLARGVFIDAATITHHSWVDGTNGREPDFDEYAGDYAESFADAYVDNITAALATPASDVVAVAWLYEIAGSGVWRLYKTRYTSPQQVAEGWTETPLYAHPPAHPVDHVAGEALREALEALRPFADVAEEQDPDCTPIEERRADDDYVLYYPNWASGLEVGDLRRAKIAYDKLAALKGPAA
ncbi:hypothetical protein CJD35_13770 [Sphingobium xenophagum]|uniref:Uncharacterized protein n=1 Tax=Sphingobium xenophagum TaxID=121428 RepID=A0A249MVI2_SPHXE|nr:hypothetical protein [Sphingobium xenophagum]ASY45383.1 hypothetical protein CJD35_13770 [Sphingobium xenophagum]